MNSDTPHPNSVLFSSPSLRNWVVLVVVLLGLLTQRSALAAADAFDEALDKLVTDAVKAVEESGKKKIAVLDFPDIAGANSAFGKYLAEQVSVGMVTAKKGFTVVDRSNLRSILAEHQLTEEGLVKPENAKQLGEFSGVDALVLGTITSVNSGHIITIKVLATDKAEIVGAAKVKLPLNPDFDAVISTDVARGDSKLPAAGEKKTPLEFKSEYFKATVKKLQILKSGEILLFVDFQKMKNESSVAVYLHGYDEGYRPFSADSLEQTKLKAVMAMPTILRSTAGDEYRMVAAQGISIFNVYMSEFKNGEMTSLSETQPTSATIRFKSSEGGKGSVPATTSFTLDSNIGIGLKRPGDWMRRESGIVNLHIDNIR